MSLNYNELMQELAKQPEVREAVRAKAEQLRGMMEARWPEVNDLTDEQRAFLEDQPGRTIKITESTRSNRPTHVVTVRHPGAVAKQAKSSFATKAVKDVE